MISICIPVFNVEIYSLVQELSNQLSLLQIEGEIIVYDDFSGLHYRNKNKDLSTIKYVVYKELSENYGRIKIRNLLAFSANYDWLLFIDCDSEIRYSFLSAYINVLKDKNVIYAGGTVYQNSKPDCSKMLHWKYGSKRESSKNSRFGFHTNNFCIYRSVFLSLNFPPQLMGYGHEDTWMGIELIRLQKKIHIINNPVVHLGLETSEIFLVKIQQALNNLFVLATVFNKHIVRKYVRLYNVFYWQKITGLKWITGFIFKLFEKKIMRNLHSCNPSLFFFDFYRLYLLFKVSKSLKAKISK